MTISTTALTDKNLYAYCDNNPIMRKDIKGTCWITTGVILTGGLVGGLLGILSAEASGESYIKGFVEGMMTGMLASASGLFLTPTAAITASFFGGCVIDGAVQLATYKNGDFESFKPNMKNILKTGIQTAIGAAVPGYGNAREVLDDAIGTAIIWAEASIGITCADIIRTIRKETKKPKINSYVYTVYNGSRVVARLSR